jgi:hypothetical protein
MATFDQTEQTIMYQYNAAGTINFSLVQNKYQLFTQLRKLVEEINLARVAGVVNEDIGIDVDAKLRKAVVQFERPNPDKKTIIDQINEAKVLLGSRTSASGLVKPLVEVISVVRRFVI